MRLLVIRTSAMGDVALITPVLLAMTEQHPDLEMVLLTRTGFKPFFSSIKGLTLFTPDLKERHKGLSGIVRLYRDLKSTGKFGYVIDLHDVLRSKVLRLLFRLSGVKVFYIDKGRGDKKAVIKGIRREKLKHSVERYTDVFMKAGFSIELTKGPWIIPSSESLVKADFLTGKGDHLKIGVAPFAKHKLKMWPEENMVRLLNLISEKHIAKYFLFGGMEEAEGLKTFQTKIKDSVNTVGNLTLGEDLALMSRLDLMIAMDSSNMHMASLVGTKVISIWGATDPVSGFGAWMQPGSYSVGIPVSELDCRPCTTFGKGECRRGDFACMNWLTPERVFKLIEEQIFNAK